jgi:hypothetical protein
MVIVDSRRLEKVDDMKLESIIVVIIELGIFSWSFFLLMISQIVNK